MDLNWYVWNHNGQEVPADKGITYRQQTEAQRGPKPREYQLPLCPHVSSLGLGLRDQDSMSHMAWGGLMTRTRKRPDRGWESVDLAL